MEITVLTDLRTGQNQIGRWLKEEDALQIDFPDDTAEILKKIISDRI